MPEFSWSWICRNVVPVEIVFFFSIFQLVEWGGEEDEEEEEEEEDDDDEDMGVEENVSASSSFLYINKSDCVKLGFKIIGVVSARIM